MEQDPDMMPLSASKILYRMVGPIPLDGNPIVFNDYFGNVDEFESFYWPRKCALDIERCLKLMKRGHRFRVCDFEDGAEALKVFGIKDRRLKQR